MSEFKIRLQTEIDSSQAESQLQKLQSVADKKKIKLNVEVNDFANSNGQLNKIKTSLSKAFKLDSSSLSGLKQVQSALKEVNKLINQTSTNKKATNSIISQYKQLASESIAIQKQMSKTVDVNAYKALEQQLSYVISKMNTLKSTMNNAQISSLEVFDDKIARNLERSYVSSFSKIQSEVVKLDSKLASLSKSGYTDKSRISSLVNDLSKIKDIDLNNLSSSGLKTLTSDLEQIKNKIKDIENGAKELKFKDKLQLDTSKVQNDLNKLRQSCENVGKSTSDIDKLENELRQLSNLPMDQVPTALSKIKTEVNSMKSSLSGLNVTTKETSSFFRELYSSFSTFGLANILADGLQSAIRSVKDTVIELDNSFRDLMKVAPDTFKGTREELNQLREDAISAGVEVARSSNDIIDGTTAAFQLGIKNIKEALEYSKQAAQFANVADLDQNQANEYLAAITAAYGGAANALKPLQGELKKTGEAYSSMTKFADLANYAGNNFSLTSADVGDALSRSASILNSLDTSMEDSVALIVGLQEITQNSQKTGTSLKAMATNLSAVKTSMKDGTITANKTNKAFKQIGIDIWNKQTGEIKSTIDVLSELSAKWDDLTTAEKAAVSESLGGKEHINSVIGLMDNWEQVVKFQQEYSAGMMENSAKIENDKFVNSIEGRLVRLSEEFKKLTTTLVTTDMFKSLVTGAADFLSILNNIISAFDKVGMGTPLLAGTVTSLFSLIKSKGTGTDLPNYFGSLINGFNSLSDKSTVTSARISKANNTISKSFVSTGNSLSSINGQTIKYTATANNLSKIQSKQAPILKNTANGYSTLTVATKNSMKSIVTATAKNALMSTGLTLLNGAFVGLAIAGVGAAVKAFDNYINRVDIAREKNQERIDEINTEISSYQTQKSGLKSIQKEYDELNNKTNRTKEESARLLELNQELAQLMPELVSGYDEAGNPIINMRGDVADLISDLDQAIERKNQLLASEKREQAELAIEKLNEVEVGGLGGGANVYYDTAQEKLNAIQEEYNTKLIKIQKDRDDILDKMGKSSNKKREQYQQELRKNLQQELDLQNEYVGKYEEKYSEIQTLTNEISEGVFSGVKTSSMFTNDFSDDVKKQLLGLQDSLDFSELETSDDINKAKQAILELGTAAATGKVDLTDLKKTVDDTNQQFQNGQISYTEYTQKLNELSETIGEITNTDPSFWNNMFRSLSEGSLTTSRDLDSFLKTFNKTRKDLLSGDSVAAQLEREFRAVGSAFDELSNLPADVGIEPIISISNSADLPKEISYLLKRLVADNDFSMEDQKIALDVMLAYQQGDSSSARKVIEEINKDLKSQGLPEINADVLFEAKVDTTEIENQLKKYKNVNSREEIKTLFTTEVVGMDKLELYEETIKKLPANKDNTTRFLAECHGDLEELNSYEEVSKWLMANPEIMTKYGITLEGSEGIIQVNNELSKLPIEKSVLVKVNKGLAEGNIDAVASAIESLPPEKRLQVIAAIEKAMGNISTVDQRKLKDKLTTLRADATKATKTIDTVEGKKINDKTFTVTAKDKSTGVLSGIKGWLDSIFSKTITVTTNKVTKSTFVGGGGGHAAEGISLSSYSKTLSQTDASNEIALLSENDTTTPLTGSETNGYSSARISTRATQKTPIDNSGTKINESIKYNIEMLTELENRIKMVTNSLSALDTKMEQAVGSNKIKYLKEQNQLYEEQKRIQKELEDSLIRQRNYYKYTLENKGFKFNSDGNLINYEEKLASMEKYVASLEKAAKNASDKNKESAQNKYENEKDKLDEVKKYLQAYIDVQMTELPKCKEEWDKLSNSIIENNNEIKKIQNEKWTLNIESQWNVLNQDLEKINNQLEMIDILMKNAFGNDKSNLISEKIELLKMQKSELASNLSYLKDIQFELKNKLSKYGFKFDSSGNISNYVNQLNKLKDTSNEFDDAKKIVDAYLELFLDKIPDVEREIAGLQNTIKDSYNDQLEITKKMEDTITNMYKKQLEDRTKLIESELDAKLKALDKEQKAYNDARSEVDYQNEYSEQLDIVTELQRKLENAARDTSVQGQKKYQDLLKELKEEQKNLEQITQNRLDDQVNNSFEDEKERLENESEELIKNLEEKFSDSNIAKMVAEALGSGLFTSIDGQVVKLQSAMEEFLTETGELFGVQGAIIEKEYLSNLQIALNTLKDIKNIYKELEVSKLDKITTDVFNPNTINSRSSNLSINSPLVYVEGNVNSDVVKELEDAAVKIKDDILYELARNTR